MEFISVLLVKINKCTALAEFICIVVIDFCIYIFCNIQVNIHHPLRMGQKPKLCFPSLIIWDYTGNWRPNLAWEDNVVTTLLLVAGSTPSNPRNIWWKSVKLKVRSLIQLHKMDVDQCIRPINIQLPHATPIHYLHTKFPI